MDKVPREYHSFEPTTLSRGSMVEASARKPTGSTTQSSVLAHKECSCKAPATLALSFLTITWLMSKSGRVV